MHWVDWLMATKQTWLILVCRLKVQNSFLVETCGEYFIPGSFMYNNEKFMDNGEVAIVGCHQMGSFPSRPGCYFYRILSTNRFASRNYYWAHDMFSRIFWIQIDELFHHYCSVEKENKFIFGQERHFFLSFEHLRKSKQILNNIW